jgi:hypothetical protein
MIGYLRGYFILPQTFAVCLCVWECDNEMKYRKVRDCSSRKVKYTMYKCNTNQRTALELMWMQRSTNRDRHTIGSSSTFITEGQYSRCHAQGREIFACHDHIQRIVLSVNFCVKHLRGCIIKQCCRALCR